MAGRLEGATGGGTYDDFAIYISREVTKQELKEINKSYRDPRFQNNPKLILDDINKKLDKWFGSANKTQKENFKEFKRKNLISLDKLEYESRGEEVNFNPLFDEYKKVGNKVMPAPEIVSNRVEKTLDVIRTKEGITPEEAKNFLIRKIRSGGNVSGLGITFNEKNIIKLNALTDSELKNLWERNKTKLTSNSEKSKMIKKIEKDIEMSILGGNYQNLVELRDALVDIPKLKREDAEKNINSVAAKKLYDKVDKALKDIYATPGFNLRSKDPRQLKEILEIKGINTTNLNTDKKIKDAAKKAGVGLRNYQKSKEDLIYEIRQTNERYGIDQLKNKGFDELERINKKINPIIYKKKNDFYIKRDQLPSTYFGALNLLKGSGVKIDENAFQKEIDKEEKRIKKITSFKRKKSKKPTSFYTTDQIERDAIKEATSNILFTDKKIPASPVIEEEIENRFLEKRKKEYRKKGINDIQFKVKKDIADLTRKELNSLVKKKEYEYVDNQGNKVTRSVNLDNKLVAGFQDKLRDEVQKISQVVDVNRESKIFDLIDKDTREISRDFTKISPLDVEERKQMRKFLESEEMGLLPELTQRTGKEKKILKESKKLNLTGKEKVKEIGGSFEIAKDVKKEDE